MTTAIVQHKFCDGPVHGGELVSLPLTPEYWYFYKSGPKQGVPHYPCKLCYNWSQALYKGRDPVRGNMVDCKPLRKFVKELVQRCGNQRAASLYCGVTDSTLHRILNKDNRDQCKVQRGSAEKILRGLDEKRREDRRNGTIHRNFRNAMTEQALQIDRVERSLY